MENKKVSIQELVDTIAAQSNFSKRFTESFLHELVAVIQEYLEKDGIVKVKGLGTFKLIWNEERKSINVSTGKELVLPAHYKVSFIPETSVKEKVNAPYAHLETVMGGAELISEEPQEQVLGETTPPVRPVPVEEPAAPVEESTTPVEESTTPVEESTTPVEEPASPVEEPVAPVTPVTPNAVGETPKKKRSVASIIVGIVIVVCVLIGCTLAYFYYAKGITWESLDELYSFGGNQEQAEPATQSVVPAEKFATPVEGEAEEGAEEVALPDTSAQVEDIYAATGTQPKVLTTQNYTYQDALNAPTREVVTVIPGSRLTMISYRAYGSKDFWVYVYDANRAILTDPASVEKGMQLRIADLPQSLVNPNDPTCIQKARELAREY